MKLFGRKIGDSRSRRKSRLLLSQLRELGMLAIIIAASASMVFTGYHSGSFQKLGGWVTSKALAYSAAAGFKVKNILVTGRSRIDAGELISHLSIKENMPIFGVNIIEAKKSLTAIPWVSDVSISRRLPDKIIVELQERVPVALWQYQKKISAIDRNGAVLTSEGLDAWRQLPLIVGEDAPKHVVELLGLLEAEPAIAKELASATRVGGRRWDLRLKNGISVKLPEQDVEMALRRLVTAEEQKNILGRNIAGIDLRQPEKMVVTPITSTGSAAPVEKNKKTSI